MEKKQNKFESGYQSEPQTAVAGTKHTITTDTNRILHRKLVSKPLPNSFQNPLSRRGKTGEGYMGDLSRCPCPHSKQKTWRTITENPATTTIDKTGDENQIKTEINEIPNTNELDNNNQQNRRSSRLRSNNPIIRFGNPLTH